MIFDATLSGYDSTIEADCCTWVPVYVSIDDLVDIETTTRCDLGWASQRLVQADRLSADR
jgi:hypothetical protein